MKHYGIENTGTLSSDALVMTTATELTIASGIVTITQSSHTIDTQSDASTDDLDTINGNTNGQLLYLRAANAARAVSVTTNGNILTGGSAITLDTTKIIAFLYDSLLSKWTIAGGSGGGAAGFDPIGMQVFM